MVNFHKKEKTLNLLIRKRKKERKARNSFQKQKVICDINGPRLAKDAVTISLCVKYLWWS